MLIAAVVLVLGLGGAKIGAGGFELSGVGLAAIGGIILNKVLPEKGYTKSEER
jgi:uracil permease